MNESTDLCLSCGLCCDGTLIGFVKLDPNEITKVKEVKTIEEVNGNGFFLQPCRDYCDGCTIYAQRPKQCASFKCGLLRSFEQKTVDFESAINAINTVKQTRDRIDQTIAILGLGLKPKSFYFKILELKKLFKSREAKLNSSQNQKDLDLDLDLKQLDRILLEKFDLS